ncbi:MAG TPA: DNA alkylation repair protein [Spirochaetia bacterium]|nr:MAG: DNA alkylation repair protein [Spirochaetes bacterium GWB1_36_13]HCL57784.1 DNA alkylation repair protein [Spirochaetia bacterium]
MILIDKIKNDLKEFSDQKKKGFLPRFFQAFPGGYAEGDQFIGVTVPNQRMIAKKYFQDISLEETASLLREPIHEYRLTALFLLVYKFEKQKSEREAIVKLYLSHTDYVNNWDLVDSSAEKILGAYLFDQDKKILYDFAASKDLWQNRIAMIASFYFIKKKKFADALKIAEILILHPHDLIHKAVGWMLREIGKRDLETEIEFLKKHYRTMPRTMLRYAIEKFEEPLRQDFLKGLI